jgi:hypothetical protein
MTQIQPLAHVGPLGHHDMWIIIPMVVLSIVVLIVMARPKRPTTVEEEERERGEG